MSKTCHKQSNVFERLYSQRKPKVVEEVFEDEIRIQKALQAAEHAYLHSNRTFGDLKKQYHVEPVVTKPTCHSDVGKVAQRNSVLNDDDLVKYGLVQSSAPNQIHIRHAQSDETANEINELKQFLKTKNQTNNENCSAFVDAKNSQSLTWEDLCKLSNECQSSEDLHLAENANTPNDVGQDRIKEMLYGILSQKVDAVKMSRELAALKKSHETLALSIMNQNEELKKLKDLREHDKQTLMEEINSLRMDLTTLRKTSSLSSYSYDKTANPPTTNPYNEVCQATNDASIWKDTENLIEKLRQKHFESKRKLDQLKLN